MVVRLTQETISAHFYRWPIITEAEIQVRLCGHLSLLQQSDIVVKNSLTLKEHVGTRHELQLKVNMFLTILPLSLLAAGPRPGLGLVVQLHTPIMARLAGGDLPLIRR